MNCTEPLVCDIKQLSRHPESGQGSDFRQSHQNDAELLPALRRGPGTQHEDGAWQPSMLQHRAPGSLVPPRAGRSLCSPCRTLRGGGQGGGLGSGGWLGSCPCTQSKHRWQPGEISRRGFEVWRKSKTKGNGRQASLEHEKANKPCGFSDLFVLDSFKRGFEIAGNKFLEMRSCYFS